MEVLVFAHPEAGIQIVKGTVEPGESVEEAASRELAEESGIAGARCARDLGTWEHCPRDQVWHFRQMAVLRELPESWEHFAADAGGHTFRFGWHKLASPAPASCHPVFVGALAFLRARLAVLATEHLHADRSGPA